MEIVYSCNDSVFFTGYLADSIPPGGSTVYPLLLNDIPEWMHGECLFRVAVNPGQAHVEKDGLDDNSGYQGRSVLYRPEGELDVCMPPGGRTNLPVVQVTLSAAS